jgi:hypothetical protein
MLKRIARSGQSNEKACISKKHKSKENAQAKRKSDTKAVKRVLKRKNPRGKSRNDKDTSRLET